MVLTTVFIIGPSRRWTWKSADAGSSRPSNFERSPIAVSEEETEGLEVYGLVPGSVLRFSGS